MLHEISGKYTRRFGNNCVSLKTRIQKCKYNFAFISVSLTLLIIGRDICLIAYTMHKRYETLEPPKTFLRYWDPNRSTVNITPTMISKVRTVSKCCSTLFVNLLMATHVRFRDIKVVLILSPINCCRSYI